MSPSFRTVPRWLAAAILLVLAGLAGAVVWVTAMAGFARDPRFSGRTAEEWLERAGSAEAGSKAEAEKVLSGEAVPGLVQTLRSPGQDSRFHQTVTALVNVVPGVSIEMPTVAEQQVMAAKRLGMLGAYAHPAVGVLLEILASLRADAELRSAVAGALGRLRADPDRVIPQLTTALRDPESDSNLRATAAFALAGYGPAASNATPVLLDLLDAPKDSKDLWTSVRYALKEIAPEAAARAGIR